MQKIVIPNITLKHIYLIDKHGRVYSEYSQKFLTPLPLSTGYLRYGLMTTLGLKYFMAHRLVMMVFKPLSNYEILQVNHIDGVKSNNNIENLEWCTGSENVIHALKTGLKTPAKGESVGGSKLTEKDVSNIIDLLLNTNKSLSQIASIFNVSRYTIFDIKRKKSWKHLTKNVNFK